MRYEDLSFAQHAIARGVVAWCAAEGIGVTRAVVRILSTPVRADETTIQLQLEESALRIERAQVVLVMPHRVVEWAYDQDADVAELVGAITRMIETG